jgi:hypothetical protein
LAGLGALLAWLLFATLGPTLLGIDHQGLIDIVHAGDHTALQKNFGPYPLRVLAPLAFGAGLAALAAAWLWTRTRRAADPPIVKRREAILAR